MEKHATNFRVYLRYFAKNGEQFLKVGITSAKDAEDRLLENHRLDDKVSWLDYFDKTNLIASVGCPSREHALLVEKAVLTSWGKRDVYFDQNFSGITEVRRFTEERIQVAKEKFNIARELNKTGWQ